VSKPRKTLGRHVLERSNMVNLCKPQTHIDSFMSPTPDTLLGMDMTRGDERPPSPPPPPPQPTPSWPPRKIRESEIGG